MDISSDEEAWLEEAGVEEYWLAEHLIDITDYEGDIFEAYLDEDEADTPLPEAGMDQICTTTMDDGEISEAKVIEYLIYGTYRHIVPLLDASFRNKLA